MELAIGDRKIGDGHPCFIVAEIGLNHNGNMGLARKQIDAAKETGADGVKFQNYKTEDFVPNKSLTYTYTSQGKEVTESQYDLFKRNELSREQLHELKSYCDQVGIIFHSTPTSAEGIKDLVNAGVPVLKNGSDFLRHVSLIEEMARTGLPTVLSTGMAIREEIQDAVDMFRTISNKLVLLHCTSSYPAPPESISLPTIQELRKCFHCLVGLSDHSEGTEAAIGAVALGACWIEKHFTIDRALPGPDHWFSSTPDTMSALVKGVRTMEKMMLAHGIGPAPSERENRLNYQISCCATKDLPADHIIEKQDIGFFRPGTGVLPKDTAMLIGKMLKKNVKAGAMILPEHLRETAS